MSPKNTFRVGLVIVIFVIAAILTWGEEEKQLLSQDTSSQGASVSRVYSGSSPVGQISSNGPSAQIGEIARLCLSRTWTNRTTDVSECIVEIYNILTPPKQTDSNMTTSSYGTVGRQADLTREQQSGEVGYTKCSYNQVTNTITIAFRSGADKPAATEACKATFGF